MKTVNIYDPADRLLFSGTKQEVKKFLREKKIKRYHIRERFTEKIALFTADENNENHLAKPATAEGDFNRVF